MVQDVVELLVEPNSLEACFPITAPCCSADICHVHVDMLGDILPLKHEIDSNNSEEATEEVDNVELLEVALWTSYFERLPPSGSLSLPSSAAPPKLELKVLPNELKYAFLGTEDTFPVVISA